MLNRAPSNRIGGNLGTASAVSTRVIFSHPTLTTALCALSILGSASAAKKPTGLIATGIAERFQQFDRDGNGKLEGKELDAELWLKRLDVNADGAVTLEEAQRVLAKFLQPEPEPAAAAEATAPPPFQPEDSPREEPQLLKAGDAGVGRLVPDLTVTDLEGKSRRLSELQSGHPLVIALYSPSCPIAKRYGPTLAQLDAEYGSKGVRFLVLAPTATDTPQALRTALADAALKVPCAPDPSGVAARTLGAKSSTDVFLLDAARTLIYRGAIDDQYGLGYSRNAPQHRYLADALDAVLVGTAPAIAATEAPGCLLDVALAQPVSASAPTFHNRISRILQANCQECHREGGVAPFALETYEQVSAKAGMIRKMVDRGLMPPWFAAAPPPGQHSPWMNDHSLSSEDRRDLLAWIAASKPAGDPREAPVPRRWPGEWQIGTPDAIVQIPQPIEVKATGTMPYQMVRVTTGIAEDRWVQALEVQPTAREVVHHVLIFVQEKGHAARRPQDGELGGFFAAYVPGNNALTYPAGFAKPLPGGAQLLFQIHYTPNGSAARDQVRLGLRFAKAPPQHVVHTTGIADHRLSIPPGAENHAESASIPVPRDVRLLAFMPHMHVRGKAFRYEAILPDGSTRTLLEVPRYDFNWQLSYRYAEPPLLPAGSKVRAIGWFDNSPKNPANPDPAKTVRWGPQTTDEMMLGYLEFYFPEEAALSVR